jgi:hypothetical protein
MRRAVLLCLAALCLPAAANPPAAASLASATLPAQEETATLLHVQAPGRFALVAHGASGAALQLVDMLSGPGDMAGEPGAQDGRIDALLDRGTYKLRVFSAAKAKGNVALSVLPFRDAAPPSSVPPPGLLLSAELNDLQQRSFWMEMPAPGGLRIAATGRALADLVVFRDGRDLVTLPLVSRLVEPGAKAHPAQNGLVVNRSFYRVVAEHPLARIDPGPDGAYHLHVGEVVEEVDELQTLEYRNNLALHMPLAAGMEPLNPALATATAEATPSAPPTVAPSYARFGDDEVLNVWLGFARGTATLRMRLRATFAGTFTAPSAWAEALYNPGVAGNSAGAAIVVEK